MMTIRFGSCLFSLSLALALAVNASLPAMADDNPTISAWYAALIDSDRAGFGELLAVDAVIVLQDLGITQTKAEFIAALDAWETAAEGVRIRHRVDGGENGLIAVAVCYDFPDNQLLTRELSAIEANRITKSVQAGVSDDCGDL
ncbi:hypothetical protein [Nitratireductor soli]|uniref:hypothetical protein n=1 Tax=Nitratireductor soli TaxID=1670619 RepID=UPI00065E8076|nr:hypothetical protein [Nitratireductor soli]